MVPGSPVVHDLCAALRSKSGSHTSFFAAARPQIVRVRCAQGGRVDELSDVLTRVCAARDLLSDVQDDQRPGTGHQVDRTIVRTMKQVRIWHMAQYPLQTVPAHAVWMMS